jgi:hypothetical protein
MAGNAEIKRDNTGKLHLFVAGVPALDVVVSAFNTVDGSLCAVCYVPLDKITIGEVDTVIPMARKDAAVQVPWRLGGRA